MTPTEDLIGELLAARHRLGEHVWTLHSQHTAAVRRLEKRGLVGWKRGVVEHTLLAWLTDEGREAFLSPDYAPPRSGVGTRGEYTLPEVAKAAEAIRSLHPSWFRKLRNKKTSEEDRQLAALEMAYRILNPDAPWGRVPIERGPEL